MKRYGKVFIMSLLSIFALAVPVFAREMTPQELGTKAKEQIPKTSYLYVIGEYAFTSEHTLTTQDVMLAARSIDAKDINGKTQDDNIYKEMTIFQLKGEYDDSGDFTGNWKKGNNVVGTSQLGDNLNIRYIDYNYVKDMYKVTLDLDGGKLPEGQESSLDILEGDKIKETDITGDNKPTKNGFQFKEWVLVNGETEGEAWNFETPVTSNITLKATWYEEVNTDALLGTLASAIKGTDYGATFANGTLTYNIYDLNKKSSEIKDTGLVKAIRDILKNENVKELIVNEIKFSFDNSEVDENEEESKVYEKLQEVLAKVTGKEFNNIVQSDLVGKELTLTITLDKDKACSQKNNVSEEYEIEISYNAPATVTVPGEDEDFKEFNYTLENTYTISGKEGLYNVTGIVSEQEGVKGFGNNTTGFYFAYKIKLNDGIDASKAKVKVPTDSLETKYNEENFNTKTRTVTVLMEVEESEIGEEAKNGYRDIIVEISGVPTKIRINFSELKLEKNSKSSIEEAKTQQKLEDSYDWTAPENYEVSYNVQTNNTIEATIKVAGFLPIYNGKTDKLPFGKGHDTGYYIAFAIKTKNEKTDNTTVDIEDGEEKFSWKSKDFDEKETIYILKHLHPEKEARTFTIVVDMDGAEEKYEPYTITVDWSELKLQNTSKGNFENYEIATEDNISSDTVALAELAKYGYNFETSKEVTVKMQGTNKKGIEGTIKEQTLKDAFAENTGYFVPVKVEFPGRDNNNLSQYSDKWTLILNTENDETKTYTPTDEEYKQGWVLVLFKIKKDGKHEISYKVDFDGKEIDFLPEEYTIDYSDLKFAEAHQVSFKGTETTPITVWDGDKITEDMLPKTNPTATDSYHEFAYWNKEDGTKFDSIEFTYEGDNEAGSKETGDVTLVPHWNLNSDKFVTDVINDLNSNDTKYSQDFTNKFNLIIDAENNANITIKVLNPEMLLNEMNSTSIPGAIAYALVQNEVQEISLKVVDEKENYTTSFDKKGVITGLSMASEVLPEVSALKEKVQTGAKELFKKVIEANGKQEETMTLSEMANGKNPSFKIKIVKNDETVTLVGNGENPIKEYTFTFKSDVVMVKSEVDLIRELSNPQAKTIYIGDNFNVNNSVDITREGVVIIGGKHKITATGKPVFTISTSNVTINDLALASDKEGIVVNEGGKLNSTDLTVTECIEAGITVKVGGSFTGDKLVRDNEKYEKPLVKAENDSGRKKAIVDVKNSKGDTATATTIEEIIPYTYHPETDDTKFELGETKQVKQGYGYKHYYLNSDVANRWIQITYVGNRSITKTPKIYVLYYDRESGNKNAPEPADNIKYLTLYSDANAEYKVTKWLGDGDVSYNTGSIPAPTREIKYTAEYTAEYKAHAREVRDEVSLKDALNNDDVKTIIVTTEIELEDKLVINKPNKVITGSRSGSREIVGTIKGEIEIAEEATGVLFDEIKITGSSKSSQNAHVVTVKAKEFRSDESEYRAEGDNFDSLIYFDIPNPKATVFFNKLYGKNVKSSLIEFAKQVDGRSGDGIGDDAGTVFTGNEFYDEGNKLTLIKLKDIKDSSTFYVRQTELRMNNDETIFLQLNAKPINSNVKLYISSLWTSKGQQKVAKIMVDTTTQKDASGIELEKYISEPTKIEIVYTTDDKTGEVQGEVEVPEQAVINGLKLNGNTYSGIINQSEDGNFYLPVTLTSNDFKDRVSTVKVTDPNGIVKNYLYDSNSKDGIATVSNSKTMNLQLEAIKSSKITGNNGKVYKLELDADGANSNAYKIKEYTINYSDVETLEEIINKAASATLEATSFTVEKDNHINGYTEEFIYKYNKEQGLTYLKAEKDNVEEYTFSSAKYAGVDSSKLSVVARKRKDNEEDSKVYLNDWVYVHPQQVGRAIHEVSMLTDVMGETPINAIDKVEKDKDKPHTYIVKLNRDKYNNWVKTNYLSNSSYSSAEWALNETVTVYVTLDDTEQYIKNIKTSQKSSENIFDVTFTDVNNTKIQEPTEFFAKDGEKLTEQDIKDFYEKGKQWWDKHIHENAYKEQ